MRLALTYLSHPYSLILFAALADCAAAYAIKLRFNELGSINYSSFSDLFTYGLNLIRSWVFVSGLFAYVCAPILSFVALSKTDLSTYYPISVVFHLIFIVLLASLLGESFTLFKVIGILLLIMSLTFLFKG